MRVRVNEAGDDDAPSEIEFAGAAGFGDALDTTVRTDSCDASVANEDGAIAEDAWLGKSFAATRHGATKREDLRAIGEELIRGATGVGHFDWDVHGTEKRGEAQ